MKTHAPRAPERLIWELLPYCKFFKQFGPGRERNAILLD
jgi:hypothetical protein